MPMRIALVAHDARKSELVEWFKYNLGSILGEGHQLFATGTTSKLLKEAMKEYILNDYHGNEEHFLARFGVTIDGFINDRIISLLSGPLGGDQQIGAMIAEDRIDSLIFFCDNLITQGHQQDVGALSRLASLYNIAFATNRTTADMIITSPLFNSGEYTRIIPTAIESYKNRAL